MKHKLIVHAADRRAEIEFEGTPVLADVLENGGFGVQRPCGSRGKCGKCAVAALSGAVSAPTAAETAAGVRLACQAVLHGDAEVTLKQATEMTQIELGSDRAEIALKPMDGALGAAVDIGTTTVALQVFDLKTGACLMQNGMLNPQTRIAADVMGRIGAAMNGSGALMQAQITDAITALLGGAQPDALVVTGNTTMLYLLTGRNPEALSHAPFLADCLFDEEAAMFGGSTYLPPCMNAFVGADISCAVLSSGMCSRDEISLLCDIGTNGEIALWKDGTLYVSSTAAGPAFEGAGISCGCGSINGAIDRVWVEDGALCAHTIGEANAVGVCGSGLIDAIAALLALEEIDETGASESDRMELKDGVALIPADVRAVQLAKAAIAAGIETLMQEAGVSSDEIGTLYIAGGFGSHLNVDSAAAIGLIPEELKPRVRVIGNAALSGAAMLLLNRDSLPEIRRIAACSQHVNLGGNPRFNANYVEQMLFPEQD